MLISFNLLFDAATEQAVLVYEKYLIGTGIPESALVRYRPHITLSAYAVRKAHVYKTTVDEVSSALNSFPLQLDSLGIFPEQGVIFLAPRMTNSLFSLHRIIIDVFANEHETLSLSGKWLHPDHWVPHVTLAKHTTAPHTLKGIEACLRYWTPLQGYATGIGMRVHPAPTDYHISSFSTRR